MTTNPWDYKINLEDYGYVPPAQVLMEQEAARAWEDPSPLYLVQDHAGPGSPEEASRRGTKSAGDFWTEQVWHSMFLGLWRQTQALAGAMPGDAPGAMRSPFTNLAEDVDAFKGSDPNFDGISYIMKEFPEWKDLDSEKGEFISSAIDQGWFDLVFSPGQAEVMLAQYTLFRSDMKNAHLPWLSGNVTGVGAYLGAATETGLGIVAASADPTVLIPYMAVGKAVHGIGNVVARAAATGGGFAGVNLAHLRLNNAINPGTFHHGPSDELAAMILGAAMGGGIVGLGWGGAKAFGKTPAGPSWRWDTHQRRLGTAIKGWEDQPFIDPVRTVRVRRPGEAVRVQGEGGFEPITVRQAFVEAQADLEATLGTRGRIAERQASVSVQPLIPRDKSHPINILLGKLKKRSEKEGWTLDLMRHKDQKIYDNFMDVSVTVNDPGFSVPAGHGELGHHAVDAGVGKVMRGFVKVQSIVTPRARMLWTTEPMMADLFQIMSGGTSLVTRGAALDPLGSKRGVSVEGFMESLGTRAEDLMDLMGMNFTKAMKDARWLNKNRGGTGVFYDGSIIDVTVAEGRQLWGEAVLDLVNRRNNQALGYSETTIPTDIHPSILESADKYGEFFDMYGRELSDVGLLDPENALKGKYRPIEFSAQKIQAEQAEFRAALIEGWRNARNLKDGKIVTDDMVLVEAAVALAMEKAAAMDLFPGGTRDAPDLFSGGTRDAPVAPAAPEVPADIVVEPEPQPTGWAEADPESGAMPTETASTPKGRDLQPDPRRQQLSTKFRNKAQEKGIPKEDVDAAETAIFEFEDKWLGRSENHQSMVSEGGKGKVVEHAETRPPKIKTNLAPTKQWTAGGIERALDQLTDKQFAITKTHGMDHDWDLHETMMVAYKSGRGISGPKGKSRITTEPNLTLIPITKEQLAHYAGIREGKNAETLGAVEAMSQDAMLEVEARLATDPAGTPHDPSNTGPAVIVHPERTSSALDEFGSFPRDERISQGGFPGKAMSVYAHGPVVKLKAPDGTTHQAQYVLYSLRDAIPSHDPTKGRSTTGGFQPNQGRTEVDGSVTPPDINLGRGYGRKGGEFNNVNQIANHPDVEQLYVFSLRGSDGPAIISSTGAVISGNGRTMAKMMIHDKAKGKENAELADRAVEYFEEEGGAAISSDMVQPDVALMLLDPKDPGVLSSIWNESTSAAYSRQGTATVRAASLSDATIDTIVHLLKDKDGVRTSVAEMLSNPARLNKVLEALVRDGALTQNDITALVDSRTGLLHRGNFTEFQDIFLTKVVGEDLSFVPPGHISDILSRVAGELINLNRGEGTAAAWATMRMPLAEYIRAFQIWKDAGGGTKGGPSVVEFFLKERPIGETNPYFGNIHAAMMAHTFHSVGGSVHKFHAKLLGYLSEVHPNRNWDPSQATFETMIGGPTGPISTDAAFAKWFGEGMPAEVLEMGDYVGGFVGDLVITRTTGGSGGLLGGGFEQTPGAIIKAEFGALDAGAEALYGHMRTIMGLEATEMVPSHNKAGLIYYDPKGWTTPGSTAQMTNAMQHLWGESTDGAVNGAQIIRKIQKHLDEAFAKYPTEAMPSGFRYVLSDLETALEILPFIEDNGPIILPDVTSISPQAIEVMESLMRAKIIQRSDAVSFDKPEAIELGEGGTMSPVDGWRTYRPDQTMLVALDDLAQIQPILQRLREEFGYRILDMNDTIRNPSVGGAAGFEITIHKPSADGPGVSMKVVLAPRSVVQVMPLVRGLERVLDVYKDLVEASKTGGDASDPSSIRLSEIKSGEEKNLRVLQTLVLHLAPLRLDTGITQWINGILEDALGRFEKGGSYRPELERSSAGMPAARARETETGEAETSVVETVSDTSTQLPKTQASTPVPESVTTERQIPTPETKASPKISDPVTKEPPVERAKPAEEPAAEDRFEKMTLGDLEPDLRGRYEEQLLARDHSSADALIDKILHPQHGSGFIDGQDGTPNHLKQRTQKLDYTKVQPWLQNNLGEMILNYSNQMKGRTAITRAIHDAAGPGGPLQKWEHVRRGGQSGKPIGKFKTLQDLEDLASAHFKAMYESASKMGNSPLAETVKAQGQKFHRDLFMPAHMAMGKNLMKGATDPNNVWSFMGRNVLALNYTRSLGSVVWPMMNDFGSGSVMAAQNPKVLRMIPKAAGIISTHARRDLEIFGVYLDRLQRMRSMADLEDYTTGVGHGAGWTKSVTAAVDKSAGRLTTVQGHISGINHMNNFSKRMATFFTIFNLNQVSKKKILAQKLVDEGMTLDAALKQVKLKRREAGKVSQMGLDVASSRRWHRLIWRHGFIEWGKHGGKNIRDVYTYQEYMANTKDLFMPNLEAWDLSPTRSGGISPTKQLFDTINSRVRDEIHRHLVVTPGLWDKPLVNQNMGFKLLNQFQTFHMAFLGQRMAPMSQMPAKYQAWFWSTYLFLGGLTDAITNHLSGRRDFDETIAKWGTDPAGMMYKSWAYSGLMGPIARGWGIMDSMGFGPGNILNNTVGGGAVMGHYGGKPGEHAIVSALGPTANLLSQGGEVLHDVFGPGKTDYRTGISAWRSLPFQNNIFARIFHKATGLPVVPESLYPED